MAIKKEKNLFRVEVYIDGRVIISKSGFKNKSLAKRWHDEMKVKLSQDANYCETIRKNKNMFFDELIDKYCNTFLKNNVKGTTLKRYMVDIKFRIKPEFSNKKIQSITPYVVQEFQNKIISNGLSANSVNHALGVLYSIFKKGIQWELCQSNPCIGIKRLKDIKKPYRWWKSREIIIKFLNTIKNNHYFPFYLLAIETGLRLGELVGLKWECIDLESGRIEVHEQYSEKLKCFMPLKNNQIRVVWIPRSSIKYYRDMKLKAKRELVFTKTNETMICSSAISGKIFKRLQTQAEVPLINFHGLRHTYASHYVMNGGNLYDLSKLLGHSSLEVTMKYAHLSEAALKANQDRVSFDLDNLTHINSLSLNHQAKIRRNHKKTG